MFNHDRLESDSESHPADADIASSASANLRSEAYDRKADGFSKGRLGSGLVETQNSSTPSLSSDQSQLLGGSKVAESQQYSGSHSRVVLTGTESVTALAGLAVANNVARGNNPLYPLNRLASKAFQDGGPISRFAQNIPGVGTPFGRRLDKGDIEAPKNNDEWDYITEQIKMQDTLRNAGRSSDLFAGIGDVVVGVLD